MASQSPTLKGSSVKLNEEDFTRLLSHAGLYDRLRNNDLYDKFDRTGSIDPYNSLKSTKEYVFFTKPDLHIFDDGNTSSLNPELNNVTIFRDALSRYKDVLMQLQVSAKGGSNKPFMNSLTNSLRSSVDMPMISADSMQTSANIHGISISYRKSSLTSDNAPEISLEFEDTKDLEIYMLFKLYDEYERRKWMGSITPPDLEYVKNKILHDQFALYKFLVDEDGETIVYYSKFYGVYPTSVPREAFSETTTAAGLRFTVQFRTQFVEDMDPAILSDFNYITNQVVNKYSKDMPLYDTALQGTNPDWANIPYVVNIKRGGASRSVYKLKWR